MEYGRVGTYSTRGENCDALVPTAEGKLEERRSNDGRSRDKRKLERMKKTCARSRVRNHFTPNHHKRVVIVRMGARDYNVVLYTADLYLTTPIPYYQTFDIIAFFSLNFGLALYPLCVL